MLGALWRLARSCWADCVVAKNRAATGKKNTDNGIRIYYNLMLRLNPIILFPPFSRRRAHQQRLGEPIPHNLLFDWIKINFRVEPLCNNTQAKYLTQRTCDLK